MDKGKKVLITGGAGYIGSHTAVCLLDQGFQVVILDNFSNSDKNALDRIEKITGKRPELLEIDMRDQQALLQAIKEHKNIDAIIHFAALKAVGESVEQPLEYYQNNLEALINLLLVLKEYNLDKLIFSSSATVYGDPDSLPIREDDPVKPALSPYGNTKNIGEQIIKDVARADASFNGISLRYFNPIGAHSSGHIGELPQGVPNNLMPYITQTAIGLRTELNVYGNDYNTPDGTAIRDYIHVVDLAEAHVTAVERLINGKQKSNYEVFNIGTGKGYSVMEVIRSFEKATGQPLPFRIVDRRLGDVEQMFADPSLAERELGWKAKRDLDTMTASSWKWEQNRIKHKL